MIEIVVYLIFVILSCLYLSWIIILLLPLKNRENIGRFHPPISIVLPAHNEGRVIRKTIESLLKARYSNKREIIVVNDGSTDDTSEIVKGLSKKHKEVKLINVKHAGKSKAINRGVKESKYDFIVTMDADSEIEKNSLMKIVRPLKDEKVGGASGMVRAKITRNPLTWFQDFEYIISSGWRFVCTRINANSYLPGFAAFKKKALIKAGGYSADTLTEDVDIVVALKRAGYETKTVNDAIMYTEVPQTLKNFIRQRFRWGRGNIQVIRKNVGFIFSRKSGVLGIFSFPTHIYWYIHALIYIPITFYLMFNDYFKYFVAKNNVISFSVAKYFFSWLSLYGMMEMFQRLMIGYYELNLGLILTITVFSLSMIYNILVLVKLSKIKIYHIFAIFFFFPYVLINLSVWGFSFLYELVRPQKTNVWDKQ